MRKWLDLLKMSAAVKIMPVRRKILEENIRRGRCFATLVILLEAIMIVVALLAGAFHIVEDYDCWTYLALYAAMLALNAAFLTLLRHRGQLDLLSDVQVGRMEALLIGYMTVVMGWGSLISLLDQALYGQVMVFAVNMIGCAVVFITSWNRMAIPFTVSSLVILAGLPFFQKDTNVLIGHYINLLIFISIAWLASRLLNAAYHRDMVSSLEMEEANRLLSAEINENQQINDRLNHVNYQLKTLSLADELTKTANRRGLRNFIDQVFEQDGTPIEHLGTLVIDLDRFKEYNDSYGHLAGDDALAAIAGILNSLVLMPWEIVARWGGEEFVILSFVRDADALNELAEAIRQQVNKMANLDSGYSLAGPITVSVGSSFRQVSKPSDVGPAIADADMAMYSAKRAGRNRVWSNPPRVSVVAVTTLEQAEEVAFIAHRIWREHYPSIISEAQVEYMLEQFQSTERIWQDIQDEHYQYDLISYQDEWVGYMAARPDKENGAYFLSKLYIDKMYRQNHLGSILLESLVTRCREQGLGKIWLTVNKGNTGSIAAYERMGFVQSGSLIKDIGSGFVMDDYVMTLTCS